VHGCELFIGHDLAPSRRRRAVFVLISKLSSLAAETCVMIHGARDRALATMLEDTTNLPIPPQLPPPTMLFST
jgi:hypothetical protein